MEEGRGGGQGSPLHAHDEYSPRVRATFVSQYVVSRERVVGRLIYSSNPLPDLPLLVPSSLVRGATIPSLQLWKERGRRSEIAGVIYLLRSDFSSLHTSTTTFLASPIPTPEPTVIYDSSPLPLFPRYRAHESSRLHPVHTHYQKRNLYLWWNERFPYFLHELRVVDADARLSSCENFANRGFRGREGVRERSFVRSMKLFPSR